VCLLFIRQGKVVGYRAFPLVKLAMETPDILSSLIKHYYDGVGHIPAEIVLPVPLEEKTVLQDWLGEKGGREVAVIVPERGRGAKLLQLAASNARNAFESLRVSLEETEGTLRKLAEVLDLHNVPERIECFDISNIGGQYAVASLVTFLGGRPAKSAYRRFRIRTVVGADDYAMMHEVLMRRFRRDDLPRPNLLMVDGGKGQLAVALSALKDAGMTGIDVIALAKAADNAETTDPPSPRGKKKDPLSKVEDRVYLAQRKDPVYLSRWPSALFLLQRVRDEAHRFAVSYYRKVKENEDLQSILDRISGIGPFRKKVLLSHFGDVKKIRTASLEALQQLEGIGKDTAKIICAFFKDNSG
jgi:excinuclease ABC subunit C